MQLRFLSLALLQHAASVWAGGYQGCMERVQAFQAYEIDELNVPELRTIGYQCSRWVRATRTCAGTWVACQGSRPGGRCTYDEFLRTLRRLPTPNNWAVYQPGTTRLDADRTAQLCLQRYENQGRNGRVPNFHSYDVIKGERGEFNAYVERIGQVVDDTCANSRTEQNKYLFEHYDATRDRIAVLRIADHHRNLIPKMQTHFANDFEVHIQDLGPDPARPNERLQVVDFKTTVLAARNSPARGPNAADPGLRLESFLNEFYRSRDAEGRLTEDSKRALDHLTLNRTYRKQADRARSCRG